jgi:sporulation protein YlmC with PRC-barrel domain
MSKYKMRGNDLINSQGHKVATISGTRIKNDRGLTQLMIHGNDIVDDRGHKIATVSGNDIKDEKGHKIGTVDKIKKEIDGAIGGVNLVALWLGWVR